MRLKATHVVIAILAVVATYSVAKNRHYDIPDQRPGLQVKSPPYQWTPACRPDYYSDELVMRGCRREEYAIIDTQAAGLSSNSRGNHWYRIGDDAVTLVCAGFYGNCRVWSKVAGRFVR